MILRKGQHFDYSINVPFFIRSIFFAYLAYLIRKLLLKFIICAKQIVGELLDNRLDIGFIGDFINEVQCLFLNLHIMVLKAISNGALMPLDSCIVYIDYFLKLQKRHISHIILSVH